MKKNKFFILGMLVIALTLGLVFAGCNTATDDGPYTGPKSIKITGFDLELTDGLEVAIRETVGGSKTGRRYSRLSAGTGPRDITMELIDMDTTASGTHPENGEQPWTGTGNYFISFNPADGLPESVDYYYSVNGTTPSKYNIKDAVTTLKFSQFIMQE